MHKIVVLYPPQPDPDAFKAYYLETHIPLVRKLPGLLALRYSFEVQGVAAASPCRNAPTLIHYSTESSM